jgi:hypothetical protein
MNEQSNIAATVTPSEQIRILNKYNSLLAKRDIAGVQIKSSTEWLNINSSDDDHWHNVFRDREELRYKYAELTNELSDMIRKNSFLPIF